jgi:hypothetical protein
MTQTVEFLKHSVKILSQYNYIQKNISYKIFPAIERGPARGQLHRSGKTVITRHKVPLHVTIYHV